MPLELWTFADAARPEYVSAAAAVSSPGVFRLSGRRTPRKGGSYATAVQGASCPLTPDTVAVRSGRSMSVKSILHLPGWPC